MLRNLTLSALSLAGLTSTALAHTGGASSGFLIGFAHPIGGLDHVLAMVAVGLFAAALGGRALWLVPAAFVTMMAVGGAAGLASLSLPFVELGIGLSVVALGLALAFRLQMPVAISMAFVGLFAVFHGHAHGAEMPESLSGFGYGAGFVIATALLHAAGIGLGSSLGRAVHLSRAAGGVIALAGAGILAGLV